MAVYFYDSPTHDGWMNLAADRYFIENLNKNDILLYFYINDNAVIIGKNQNAWRECNLSAMEGDGVRLVRRHTGGGAVFHDVDNLNFSFIMGEQQYDVHRQMGVICRAMASFGLNAELSGRNDILIDGKKFSGNAFAAVRGMYGHHGTILVNTDVAKLAKYLNVSEKKMNAKGITSVKSRVCNLSDFDKNITVDAVKAAVLREFAAEYGDCSALELDDSAKGIIAELYAKQSSWEWRFGSSQPFDYTVEERFSFGEMQLHFSVAEGVVANAKVYSDALDTTLAETVKTAVIGARFTPGDISEKLKAASEKAELREIAEYIKNTEL